MIPSKLPHINSILMLIILLLVATIGLKGMKQEGLVLRGNLTLASPDGSDLYFSVGETLVIALPKGSSLAPGLNALIGKRVVISVFEDDRKAMKFGRLSRSTPIEGEQ